jgi:hypothetical protein
LLRNGDRKFSPSDLAGFFDTIRVPSPSNINQVLARLRRDQLALQRSPGIWSLTPVGERRATEVIGELDPMQIELELSELPGAELDHVLHRVLPPRFAPPPWAAGIAHLLRDSPFYRNVFCMTRLPEEPPVPGDLIGDAIDVLRSVCARHGLRLLASDRLAEDELWGNVSAHMWVCQYGIGLLEDRTEEGVNPNVCIELGAMLMTGRRCAMLKDVTLPEMPTDLAGHIYKPVDLTRVDDVAAVADRWITDDLALN